jgi:hypothetical protein
MVKRAKNPSQLTQEEEDMIDQVLLRWGIIYAYIKTKYRTPKKLAEKLISLSNSRKQITGILSLLNTKDRKADQVITASSLNKEVAKVMLDDDTSLQDPTDITTSVEAASDLESYINSTDRTKILKMLEHAGIYLNIKGKKEVRRQSRKSRRGRPTASDKTYEKSGGYPSIYKMTEKVKKLKELSLKPEACNRVRKTLVKSELAYNFEKFVLQALYYAAKKDTNVLKQMFRIHMPAEFIKSTQFETFQERFLSIEESKLEKKVAEGARISVENHNYDGYLFIGALVPFN